MTQAERALAARIERAVRPEVRELCVQIWALRQRLSKIAEEGATVAEYQMMMAAWGHTKEQ